MNPPKHQFDTVIFDLDGTLIDSLADIAHAANDALRAHEFPVHPVDSYRHLVGDGVVVLFQRALPPSVRDDRSVIDRCVESFKTSYDLRWKELSSPYEGIDAMLSKLVETGVSLGVLSNKPHEFTMACVEHFFPAVPWRCVLGNREETPRKPDPAGVHLILKQVGSVPERCLYVGDTDTDMRTAKAANCFALGVTWGFRPAAELQRCGADALVDHPQQLTDRYFN